MHEYYKKNICIYILSSTYQVLQFSFTIISYFIVVPWHCSIVVLCFNNTVSKCFMNHHTHYLSTHILASMTLDVPPPSTLHLRAISILKILSTFGHLCLHYYIVAYLTIKYKLKLQHYYEIYTITMKLNKFFNICSS